MRSNYWSCSDFADKIRGTDYPTYETSEGWASIEKLAKAAHPLRFWIADTVLDKIQDVYMFPSDTFYNIKYYIENRWVSRTNGLTAHPKDIKPGEWCDVGYRFLPCMFNELVDFVEVELAWSFIRWGDIYEYIGTKNYKVSDNDMTSIGHLDNEISLKYISKLIGQDIKSDISYKDLICLINSSENWQKNTI
jgi:hypothetical protein